LKGISFSVYTGGIFHPQVSIKYKKFPQECDIRHWNPECMENNFDLIHFAGKIQNFEKIGVLSKKSDI
jgi:hypothetical protein